MKAERIMDAMNYLPDELLLQTDALRQKKKYHWKRWAAVAACLCLAVGIWFIAPGAKSADNAAAPEIGFLTDNAGAGSVSQESGSTGGIIAYVYEVYEDYVTVKRHEMDGLCDCPDIVVKLDELDEIPRLSKGQKIRIYTNQEVVATVITPYKIVVMQEE